MCVYGVYVKTVFPKHPFPVTPSPSISPAAHSHHLGTHGTPKRNAAMAPPPPARKYGAPLFFCSFAPKSSSDAAEVVLGGGGGASSTGVANRLLLVRVEDNAGVKGGPHKERLESDPASELHTGNVTAVGGTLVPTKDYFIAVLSGGDGLVKYRLKSGEGDKKEFQKIDVADREKLKSFKQAEIKVATSDSTGTHVAVGYSSGKIVVYETGTFREVKSFDPSKHSEVLPEKGGVMNLCYTPCDGKLVVVRDNGTAFVWDHAAKKKTEKKESKKKSAEVAKVPGDGGMYRGCCSFEGGDGSSLFCLGVNGKDRRSKVSMWCVGGLGTGARRLVSRHAHNSAITALAGCSGAEQGRGRLVATACSEGDICIYSADHKMAVLHRVSNAHMIFVTNLAFSPDGRRLVSCSADAGARITNITKTGRQVGMEHNIFLALVALLLALLLTAVRVYLRQ